MTKKKTINTGRKNLFLIGAIIAVFISGIISGAIITKESIQKVQSDTIDPVSSETYLNNAEEFYTARDWSKTITNVNLYKHKITNISETIRPVIYLYAGYANYRIFAREYETNKRFDGVTYSLGLSEIDKYITINPTNSVAYFIKGLYYITDKTNETSLKTAKTIMQKALKVNKKYPHPRLTNEKIERHIVVCDIRMKNLINSR